MNDMIATETVTIDGVEFVRTYSDAGLGITYNGFCYTEAVDPVGNVPLYTECEANPDEEAPPEELLDILLGE